MRALHACLCAVVLAASGTACTTGTVTRTRLNFAPSMSYDAPAGWTQAASGATEWTLTEGTARHVYRVGPLPGDDIDRLATEWQNRSRAHGTVIDEGTVRVCDGGPARRWRVIGSVELHYLVTPITGGLGVAQYEHPRSASPKAEALGAMVRICPGFYDIPLFPGWKAPTRLLMFGGVQTSPDGRSTFVSHVATRKDPNWSAVLAVPAGPVLRDRTERCGISRVRRIETRRGDDTIETSIAKVRPYAYRIVYVHPTAQPPLARAERALTIMCRPPEVRWPGASAAPRSVAS